MKERGIAQIVMMLLMVFGFGASFYLVQHGTNLLPKAAYTPTSQDKPKILALADYKVSACGEIKKSGNYSITQDLTSTDVCLNIQDMHDLILDCQGHTITGKFQNINIKNVQNFSVKNCKLVITLSQENSFSRGEAIIIDDSSSGVIENNTAKEGGIRNRRSKDIKVLNNTVESQFPYNQYHSSFSVIKGNQFTAKAITAGDQIENPGGGFIGSGGADGVVVLDGGTNNTIENNVIDGGSDGINHSEGNLGADDGILLAENEKDDKIISNSIINVWDCGIENIGHLDNTQITNNKISNAGVCGIGGWYWNSWLNNKVSGNTISNVPVAFYLYRVEGFDREHNETKISFKNNTFSDNIFTNPKVFPGKSAYSASIFFDNIPSGIPSSSVDLGNNIFRNNDFGQGVVSPYIVPASMVVDQGGNKCLESNDPERPLKCNVPVSTSSPSPAPTPVATYKISGQVIATVNGNLTPLINNEITAKNTRTGKVYSTKTGFNGIYSLNNLPNDSYVVTPTRHSTPVLFTPQNKTVRVNGQNVSNVNFSYQVNYNR